MAQYKSEYTNSAVGNCCSAYKTNCSSGSPIKTYLRGHQPTGVFLTPDYAGIGYDALTHGVAGGCQKHFNFRDAYGYGARNCKTSYTSRTCGCNDDGAVGKGMDWVCSTGKCVGVHKGAQRHHGDVYHSKSTCQANCDGNVGKGYDWVCSTSQLGGGKCVSVRRGTHPYPHGDVYHTFPACKANCKPGQPP